ncbi:MAG: hypothetical protein SF097_10765 [Acidobacteriota bacterium]|nr:hypothetical protein [Acidobacteriota bacterium]
MSATIILPAELESLLGRKAAIEGINVEQFALNTLRRAAELPTISELFSEAGANGGTQEPDSQAQAMLAVLARSAERLKDLQVSGETKDTLEMIRRAREGEMWGDESANPN